jgi:hypothetical protein
LKSCRPGCRQRGLQPPHFAHQKKPEREKGFFVNSMMGPATVLEAAALKFRFDLANFSA